MSNNMRVFTIIAVIGLAACASRSDRRKGDVPAFHQINDVRSDNIRDIAISVLGRSAAEAASMQDYIETNKIENLSDDEILIPGDGSFGTSLVIRKCAPNGVTIEVFESGIEEERSKWERSNWSLTGNQWRIERLGRVSAPLQSMNPRANQ